MITVSTTRNQAEDNFTVVLEEQKDVRSDRRFFSVWVEAFRPETRRTVRVLRETMIEDRDRARNLANSRFMAIRAGARP